MTVLGHLQRGGSPSAFDRNLGTRLGTYAAELCHRGELGRRIVTRDGELASLSLSEPIAHKRVATTDSLVSAARLIGIEFGDSVPVLESDRAPIGH